MCKKMILLRPVGTALAVLALVGLTLVSCSSDEALNKATPDGNRRQMVFSVSTADYGDVTRGTPSEELEESIGLYAYTYEGDNLWVDGAGTAPDFMVNEEMQGAGSHWSTVSAFDLMEPGRSVRFYAYYPYAFDSDILSVSGATHPNAPILTYKVPANVEEQLDVLAGSSFESNGTVREYSTDTQNSTTPEAVQLTLSHILTAVRFQIGECREAGRIKSITLTSILGENSYSLQRKADDSGFNGWSNKNLDNHSDLYTNFSIDVDKAIKTTQATPQVVTSDDQWLMMIPQTLSEDSKLVVVYNSGGSDHTMEVSIDNYKWRAGKKVTYTLNILSLQRLTVKTTVENWSSGLEFTDGKPDSSPTIDTDVTVSDWDDSNNNDIASDDPRD